MPEISCLTVILGQSEPQDRKMATSVVCVEMSTTAPMRADVISKTRRTQHMPRNRHERRHPELISLRASAEYCDVDPRTVRRWIAAGRLNAYRVGPRLIKVDVAELDKIKQPVGGAA
jgi:excisionase family DNA binding protein